MPPRDPMRSRFDSDDFLQETWQRVFRQLAEGKIYPSEEDFIRVVRAATAHVYMRHWRAGRTLKRSADRERPLTPELEGTLAAGDDPGELAAAEELFGHWVGGLSGPGRALIEGVTAGEPLADVAARLGLHVRAAQRFVERARLRLDEIRARVAERSNSVEGAADRLLAAPCSPTRVGTWETCPTD